MAHSPGVLTWRGCPSSPFTPREHRPSHSDALAFSAQALLESSGEFTRDDAVAFGLTSIEKLLGIEVNDDDREMVAYARGDIFSMESKSVAVISPLHARVDIF
jgi:hypothetical protein